MGKLGTYTTKPSRHTILHAPLCHMVCAQSPADQRYRSTATSEFRWQIHLKHITWVHKPPARGNIIEAWLYAEKKQGGLGSPTIGTMLTTRKMALLQMYFIQRARNTAQPWKRFSGVPVRQQEGKNHATPLKLLLCNSTSEHMGTDLSTREHISSWWQEWWLAWINQEWAPAERCFLPSQIKQWPTCNNRLITVREEGYVSLQRSASSHVTQQIFCVIHLVGYVSFADFMNHALNIKSIDTLQAELSANLARHTITVNYILARTCTALLRRVRIMWERALTKWTGVSFTAFPVFPFQWRWIRPSYDSFTKRIIATLHRIVALTN